MCHVPAVALADYDVCTTLREELPEVRSRAEAEHEKKAKQWKAMEVAVKAHQAKTVSELLGAL